MNKILEQANQLTPEIKALKDDLHRHPEVSFQEYRTTALLKEKLTQLGLQLIDLGMETGVVALLRGEIPGPTVALRADIDAIPVQEPESHNPASLTSGVMHACGHDFHTACLYGAAKLLAGMRQDLKGNVVFLFQPAEETTGGAKEMLEHGLWDKLPEKPMCIFAQHTRPTLPCGQIAVIPGPIMAGKTQFSITLRGVTGHGGSPQKCVDVIVASAAIIEGIQTVISRNTDPRDPLVCAVFSIHAGTPDNFVPEILVMTGDIRAHSDQVTEQTGKRLSALVRGIADSYGCECDIRFFPRVPVTYNGREMTTVAYQAATKIVGEENLVVPKGDMGSEDFAIFGKEIPSFFYWIGTGFPDRENPGWHSKEFCVNDDAIPISIALMAQSALQALEK